MVGSSSWCFSTGFWVGLMLGLVVNGGCVVSTVSGFDVVSVLVSGCWVLVIRFGLSSGCSGCYGGGVRL